LSTNSLTIQKGAVIESSTNNNAPSGNIKINASGLIDISGDAFKIKLLAPANSQTQYIQLFSPRIYNRHLS